MNKSARTNANPVLVVTWRDFPSDEKTGVLGIDQAVKDFAEAVAREAYDEKIQPVLAHYGHAGPVNVDVHITHYSLEENYDVRVRLQLPGRLLFSHREDSELETAITSAVDKLSWDLEQYLKRIHRRAASRRRAEPRKSLDRLKKASENRSVADKRRFFSLIHSLLPSVRSFIAHEVNYLRSQGNLAWDFPTVQDVLDEVLVRAFSSNERVEDESALKDWLVRLSIDVLAEASAAFQAEQQMVPKEKWYEPLDEISDEEFWEFYQPDAGVRVEDLEPVDEADPAKRQESADMVRHLRGAAQQLPARWRRALELIYLNQVHPPHAAECLKVSQDELQRLLDHARAFLREKLLEAGFNPAEDGMAAAYLAPEDYSEKYRQVVEDDLRQALGLE